VRPGKGQRRTANRPDSSIRVIEEMSDLNGSHDTRKRVEVKLGIRSERTER